MLAKLCGAALDISKKRPPKQTKVVRAGDALLKENGIEHGCTCLEKGVLLDIFTPMREDFVGE